MCHRNGNMASKFLILVLLPHCFGEIRHNTGYSDPVLVKVANQDQQENDDIESNGKIQHQSKEDETIANFKTIEIPGLVKTLTEKEKVGELTWTFRGHEDFERKVTAGDFRRRLGVMPDFQRASLSPRVIGSFGGGRYANQLPDEFDARTKWPECYDIISTVYDQGGCSSCWAMAASSAMSDRLCILSKGRIKKHVSAENLLDCCKDCGFGCRGGFPGMAWKYWNKHGITSGGGYGSREGCQPYEFPPCYGFPNVCREEDQIPKCQETCLSGNRTIKYSDDLTFGSDPYLLPAIAGDIMIEIMTNGPVEATFQVRSDFLLYKSGIYIPLMENGKVPNPIIGHHAVKIVGWGVENDVPFWILGNSWGQTWGENGFFRMNRGKNICGIEEFAIAAIPSLSGRSLGNNGNDNANYFIIAMASTVVTILVIIGTMLCNESLKLYCRNKKNKRNATV